MIIELRIILLAICVFGPIYGGCFNILRQGTSVGSENPCALPSDSGMCYAAFRRYFYNTSSGRCETFTYGGCGGNENNYLTEEQCVKACGEPVDNNRKFSNLLEALVSSHLPDVCDFPKQVGPCRAGKRRYYFNGVACEAFTYGGCRANANNFKTKKDCMEKCKHKLDVGSGEAEDDLMTVPFFEEGNLFSVPSFADGNLLNVSASTNGSLLSFSIFKPNNETLL